MIYNNLCPKCNSDKEAGVDISHRTTRYKIKTNGELQDVIEVCIHPQDEEFPTQGSIMDIGVCSCGTRGFLYPPEEQIGILYLRNDVIQNIVLNVSGEIYAACSDCLPDKICDDCGKPVRILHSINGTKQVCSECINSYAKCRCCRTTYVNGQETPQLLCKDCAEDYTICVSCNTVQQKSVILNFAGEERCPKCLRMHGTCSICEATAVPVAYVGDIFSCASCVEMHRHLPSINGYGRTHVSQYLTTPDSKHQKLFFGIENEIQLKIGRSQKDNLKFRPERITINKRLAAGAVKEFFPECDIKRDGSLNSRYGGRTYENGIECVWQPMTWEYIKQSYTQFQKMFAKLTPYLHKDMAAAGMHIHLSKKAFTPLHFLKFSVFFYTLEKENLIKFISDRTFNGYARKQIRQERGQGLAYGGSPTFFAQGLAIKEAYAKKGRPCGIVRAERYDLINTTNAHTYEIRIFKGARTFEEFITRVEFTHSVFEYTRVTPNKSVTLGGYLKWVDSQTKAYKYLVNKLKSFKVGE